MRFLGIGETNDLGAMYHGLAARGHEVRVFVEQAAARDVYGGMLEFSADWQAELGWLREAGDQGMVLFESAVRGKAQDALRRESFQVIGGSALGDRLEAERDYGEHVPRGFGLHTAATHRFTAYGAARDFLHRQPGRYVLKFNGTENPRTRNDIGKMIDAADMLALLAMYEAHPGATGPPDHRAAGLRADAACAGHRSRRGRLFQRRSVFVGGLHRL